MIIVNRRYAPGQLLGSTETVWYRVTSVKLFGWWTIYRCNEQLTDPREKERPARGSDPSVPEAVPARFAAPTISVPAAPPPIPFPK